MARNRNKDDKNLGELISVRDTVESVWIAIVLAFVLRAFIIEAFVIPTGSMAPRLLGRHWDLQCEACGWRYEFGYHGEVLRDEYGRTGPSLATCPQCGYPYSTRSPQYPRSGDRVLVLKYLYHWRPPKPWDVVVFKNPQDNRQNYIKRLIGLPGETIEIVRGDVFVKNHEAGETGFRIRTKPRRAQAAMWQILFDNDFQPDAEMLRRRKVTPRGWEPVQEDGPWRLGDHGGRVFHYGGGEEYSAIQFRAPRDVFLPHYGYNAAKAESSIDPDVDVVTDLRLSAVVFVEAADASGVEMLLSGVGHTFRARIGPDGSAVIEHSTIGDDWRVMARGELEPFRPGRGYKVALNHADLTLSLEVDGEPVAQVAPQDYPLDYNDIKAMLDDSPRIPAPQVAIAARGRPVTLRHVRLLRDVYYTNQTLADVNDTARYDYIKNLVEEGFLSRARLAEEFSGTPGWGTTGHPIRLARHDEPHRDLDEFFVLGDNSPQSLDGRSWTSAAPSLRLWRKDGEVLHEHQPGAEPLYQLGTVPRYSMLGKAVFVYWPSGFSVPGLRHLRLVPNVGRMRAIR